MKTSPKLVLALLAMASCAAGAQTVYSGQADQERRDRNREEALSNYRSSTGTTAPMATRERRETAREESHEAAQSARHGAHKAADSTRRVAHKSADAARRVGHKVAVKARESTARADAKFGTVQKKDGHGEASNPTGMSNTAANGPKP
ncbi:MAG: hypothetical protein M3Z15_04630 [Pseudomonadota bacterium]|nr:hypothetical protein [Pseudomonadota bacterium]